MWIIFLTVRPNARAVFAGSANVAAVPTVNTSDVSVPKKV